MMRLWQEHCEGVLLKDVYAKAGRGAVGHVRLI